MHDAHARLRLALGGARGSSADGGTAAVTKPITRFTAPPSERTLKTLGFADDDWSVD